MPRAHLPRVSVVIPTTLRRDITPTVRSVLGQTVDVELILVVDAAQRSLPPWLEADADKIVFTGGGRGAPHARNLGVRSSSSEWIAFLDDDDLWAPEKLELQMLASQGGSDPKSMVISSRVRQVSAQGQGASKPVPANVFRRESYSSVGAYLFAKRAPTVTRNAIFTSTLLVSRRMAMLVEWDETLRRHQDWDWLLRAEAAGAFVMQLEQVLTTIAIGSPGSISASSDWRSSLDWARGHRSFLSDRAYADFLAGQSLRFALASREVEGVRAVLRELKKIGLPSGRSLALGLTGCVPRKSLEKLALASQRLG